MDSAALEISSQDALAATVASVGATDVFVFRRVPDDRFVHVGGLGRGEGWAGNVDLVVSEEPLARAAVETGEPVRIAADEPVPVFGPYYQRFAALVPVSGDVIVIFGGGQQGPLEGTDSEICEAAFDAAETIDRVSLAKRLADELEVLHAVREVVQTDARSLTDVMQHVVETAASALSCELAVLYMRERDLVAVADSSSPFPLNTRTAVPELRKLSSHIEDLPTCIQEASVKPLPGPLAPGVTSYYLLPVGTPPVGLLGLFHTQVAPRGFTMLCREVGMRDRRGCGATPTYGSDRACTRE